MLNYTYGTNGMRIPEENPYMVHLLADEDQIDDFQEKWTQIFLECKADVVIGTHPHMLQPYEVLEGDGGHRMLVYYSIGNYISAQTEKACTKGGAASFTVSLKPSGYEVTEYDLIPLTIRWEGEGKYKVE